MTTYYATPVESGGDLFTGRMVVENRPGFVPTKHIRTQGWVIGTRSDHDSVPIPGARNRADAIRRAREILNG